MAVNYNATYVTGCWFRVAVTRSGWWT